MMSITQLLVRGSLATGLIAAIGLWSPADAKCARLAFSVNDYGKEGPTKDAKALLDKHIASWTASRGISRYTASKKDVSCELFLDFGFFDEHTCKASATVCWGGGDTEKAKVKVKPATKAAAPKPATPAKAAPKRAPAEAPPAPAPTKVKAKAA